jgi:hypothetical protein
MLLRFDRLIFDVTFEMKVEWGVERHVRGSKNSRRDGPTDQSASGRSYTPVRS